MHAAGPDPSKEHVHARAVRVYPAPVAVPPIIPPELFKRFPALRETFLVYVADPPRTPYFAA
jgi:hypothetical protein